MKNMLDSARIPVQTNAKPTIVPTVTRAAPSFVTSLSTSPFCAPSAMRMPISWPRCVTEYAVTPASPTEARIKPSTPIRP